MSDQTTDTTSSTTVGYAAPPVPPAPPATSAPRPPAGASQRSRGSVMAGITLVIIGVVALAVRGIASVEWWNAWPIVVIAVGLVQAFTPSRDGSWGLDRLLEGIGTAVLGAVLLGNTTGVVPWTMWLTFISLWPVLIIAAGIGLVGKATGQSWIRAGAPLLIWATLAYAIAASLGLVTVVPNLVFVI